MTRLVTTRPFSGLAALILAASSVFAASSCSEVRSKSFEGQICSASEDENPYFECDRSRSDLVCISTYTVGNGVKAYTCRVACATSADCSQAGDVCCAGTIIRETFGKSRACVPASRCESDPGAVPPPDASTKPTPADALPQDAGAQSADAAVDAPVLDMPTAPDASADAETDA